MSRSSGNITLHLSPSEIALATARSTERLGLDPERWSGVWSDMLRALDQPLRELMVRAGVGQGSRVTVRAQTPETFIDVLTFPVAHTSVLDAARLAARDRAPFDLVRNPCAIVSLGAPAGGKSATLIVAAERNELAEAIAAWLARAGLVLDRLVPTPALVLAEAISSVWEGAGNEREAVVHIDRSCSAIATRGHGGEPGVMRSISFGLDQFAGAISRAAAAAGEGDLRDHGAALEWLLAHGLPARDQVIGRSGRLSGSSVLPAIQPVCQRFIVEIRQSLRLAFGMADVARATVILRGPGAGVRGFAGLVAEQLEIDVRTGERPPGETMSEADEGLIRALDCAPASVRARRSTRRSRAVVAACTAGAMAFVGIEGATIYPRFEAAQQRDTEYQAKIALARAELERRQHDAAFVGEVSRLAHDLKGEIGTPISAASILSMLSTLCDQSLRLTEVRIKRDGAGYRAEVMGLAFYDVRDPERSNDEDALSAFLTRASDRPELGRISLGSARAASVDERPAKVFTVVLEGLGLPVDGGVR